MKYGKKIEKFINLSIKNKSNEIELQNLLSEITKEELQGFWRDFTASKSFSKTAINISHWKTKQQKIVFQHEITNYLYQPKKREENGNYIFELNDFRSHIKSKIKNYIQKQIEIKKRINNRLFIEKIHSFFGLTALVLILPFCVVSILSFTKIGTTNTVISILISFIGVTFVIGWAIYVLLSIVISIVLKRKFRKANK